MAFRTTLTKSEIQINSEADVESGPKESHLCAPIPVRRVRAAKQSPSGNSPPQRIELPDCQDTRDQPDNIVGISSQHNGLGPETSGRELGNDGIDDGAGGKVGDGDQEDD